MKQSVLLAAILACVSAISPLSTALLQAQGDPRKIEITARRFAFEPAEITLIKGQPVVLTVKSTDVAHGIRFRELNVDVSVHARGTAEARFTPAKTGDFVGHCSVFCGAGHGTMALKLHVVDK